MAKEQEISVMSQKRFWGGQSNFPKEDIPNTFYFSQSIDFRTDPQALTLLPASLKESGNIVTGLLKFADTVPEDLSVYSYDNIGNIYKRTTAGSWSFLHWTPSSHGNGLQYFYGDDYLYYTSDSVIGRYGPMGGTPQFVDNFLGAQGGIPQNTNSLSLVAASSQYATAADSATLSVTGDLTLESEFYLNSLPAVGNSMTILGKWDESINARSYKLDIYGVSGYFGDGSDGSLTVSVDTINSPIDSACSGTAGSQALTATNVSFAAGQIVLIIQMQGAGAGKWERNTIQGYTAGTITLQTPLKNTYSGKAQVIVMPRYTNVTVNNGIAWSAKAWNGTTGGILAFLCNGSLTNNGTISGNGLGFRGVTNDGGSGKQGENTNDYSQTRSTANDTNGGGGGLQGTDVGHIEGGCGAGGGNGTAGANGSTRNTGTGGTGGSAVGSADLTTMLLGGAGGSGGADQSGNNNGAVSGNGGAMLFFTCATLTNNGTITSNGQSTANQINYSMPGAGAGGSILVKAQTATIGTMTAIGGTGGTTSGSFGGSGGNGGNGRIHLDYLTSYTNTIPANPTLNATQDNTLVTTTTYQARLGISNDGTAFEYLTQNLAGLTTGVWNRLSVAWTSSTSVAQFYLNATLIGSSTGTKNSISDNASLLYIGANKTSVVANFFDGLLDDKRIFGNVQTASQIFNNNEIELTGKEAGLKAYYTYDNVLTDKSGNANTLTNHGTTFSLNVPYPAPTARLDIDQSFTTTGSTYAVPTAISEASTDSLVFTPTLDPQKSMDVNISAKGTGNWTLTIHDQQNNVIALQTVTNANLPTSGYYEFIFTNPWRIVINKTYHAHITSTQNDGVAVSSVLNDFSKGDFHTYYQFLVTDTFAHPIIRMLNKQVIGNERYLATWDGASYNANFIAFPAGTHVRCFGFWRDYLAIGTWQEASSGTPNIYDYSVGRVYFWDGISLQFNFWIDVAEGQVNALLGIDTDLYIMAGWKGDLVLYQGGYIYASGNSQTQKVKRFPLLERSSYLEVYPQAMSVWRSMLHIGAGGSSDSSTFPRGVYSWGTIVAPYPQALSYDYPISTGNIGSTVKIGLVYAAGKDLLIGWQDGGAFGVDKVNMNNVPASYGTIQLLISDNEEIWHQEQMLKIRADHLTLQTGESITVKYKIDRESNWESVGSVTDATKKFTTNMLGNGRHRESQAAVDIFSTNGTSPTLLGISTQINKLATEQQI